jgi:hypothetical protein
MNGGASSCTCFKLRSNLLMMLPPFCNLPADSSSQSERRPVTTPNAQQTSDCLWPSLLFSALKIDRLALKDAE